MAHSKFSTKSSKKAAHHAQQLFSATDPLQPTTADTFSAKAQDLQGEFAAKQSDGVSESVYIGEQEVSKPGKTLKERERHSEEYEKELE